MPPTLTNGKICYIEMPAAEFYKQVFGWQTRRRGDGSTAFDDPTGQVSGTWVVGRAPAKEPGLLVYIMVDSVAATSEVIVANGGVIVQPIGADAPEITARFRDPWGECNRPVPATRLTGLQCGNLRLGLVSNPNRSGRIVTRDRVWRTLP